MRLFIAKIEVRNNRDIRDKRTYEIQKGSNRISFIKDTETVFTMAGGVFQFPLPSFNYGIQIDKDVGRLRITITSLHKDLILDLEGSVYYVSGASAGVMLDVSERSILQENGYNETIDDIVAAFSKGLIKFTGGLYEIQDIVANTAAR